MSLRMRLNEGYVHDFELLYPGIKVTLEAKEHEKYKI